jgi:hypothetical protein
MTPDELYRENFKNIDWSVTIQTYRAPRPRGQRSDFGCPMLIRDDIGAVMSQLDGKYYDSRSGLYQSYKQGGARIIEAGEKPVEPELDRVTKADVHQALDMVKQGYKPAPAEKIAGLDD